MTLPALFQSVLDQWEGQGIRVMRADWTTSLRRHVGATIEYKGDLAYAKLALANEGDLDESDMLAGMRREVWWSRVIERLRIEYPAFPFRSPRVFYTNFTANWHDGDVAWIIMEYITGTPIVGWEPERSNREMNQDELEQFNQLLDAVVSSLLALERVHPDMLEKLGLPPLPSPPHGMRRWQKKGLLNMETAVLGNGAFEIKNFWRDTEGQLVIMDNEFAGWYPKYDHLSYLYHRLYCNTMRPDLAKKLLGTYVHWTILNQDHYSTRLKLWELFTREFDLLLKLRLLRGWYYDTVRRKLPPWHKKQRLRYGLYLRILLGNHAKLVTF